MAEVIAHFILIGGSQLAFNIGRLFLIICSFGKLSIQPLAKKYPANFVQAFDEKKVEQTTTKANYNISYSMAITIGYIIIITFFSLILFFFRESWFQQNIQ